MARRPASAGIIRNRGGGSLTPGSDYEHLLADRCRAMRTTGPRPRSASGQRSDHCQEEETKDPDAEFQFPALLTASSSFKPLARRACQGCTWSRAVRWEPTPPQYRCRAPSWKFDSGETRTLGDSSTSLPTTPSYPSSGTRGEAPRDRLSREPMKVHSRRNPGRGGAVEDERTLLQTQTALSVPWSLAQVMRAMWRQAANEGANYLCIFEVCHNCADHQGSTKHDPQKYQDFFLEVSQWIQSEYSFVSCEALHTNNHFIRQGCRPRRIGAFEVYFMCPKGSGAGPDIYLLHSKLLTARWPTRRDLWPRLQAVLPELVQRIRTLLASRWTRDEVNAMLKEAKESGLESWESVAQLADRVRAAEDCVQQGNKASASGDTRTLRDAVRKAEELGCASMGDAAPTMIAEWREDLKTKNMMLFNMKMYAKRFRVNAAFVAAVQMLKAAAVHPLRVESLEKAVEKAYAAEIPEEDFEEVAELLSRSMDIRESLECALEAHDLEGLAKSMGDAAEVKLCDEILDRCYHQIARLAGEVQRAAETHDLVELTEAFATWSMPSQAGSAAWNWPDFACLLNAERERMRLQGKVDEAQKRFESGNWKALQSSMDRLRDVRLEESTWERWTSALQRECNFTVIKAVSSAGVALKRKLHTNRLQTALRAKSIAIECLEAAADEAASHGVDESLVARARSDASTARQRLRQAEDAVKRKCPDVAEVCLWKLRCGKVRMEEETQRDGPLWAMADAVRRAEANKDWQAMQIAIQGWIEDKPGMDHEAFKQDDSPTRTLRRAHDRIKELQLAELREQLNAAVDSLAESPGEDVRTELQQISALLRKLTDLGWELTPLRKGRLLSLLAIVKANACNAGPARFAQAALRVLDKSARIVFVMDQCKTTRRDIFEEQLKPALIAVAKGFQRHAKDTLFAAVAHGPLKPVQELTSDLDCFTKAVLAQPFEGGKAMPAKALKEALKIFKLKFGEAADDGPGPDPLCFVFNFICSSKSDTVKDCKKALTLLEVQGVSVVSVGVGPGLQMNDLQQLSSPGLAFRVEDSSKLQTFMEDAFSTLEAILTDARATEPAEAVFHRFEEMAAVG